MTPSFLPEPCLPSRAPDRAPRTQGAQDTHALGPRPHIHTETHTHTHLHGHTLTHMPAWALTHKHTPTCAHAHTPTPVCAHAHTPACTHSHTHRQRLTVEVGTVCHQRRPYPASWPLSPLPVADDPWDRERPAYLFSSVRMGVWNLGKALFPRGNPRFLRCLSCHRIQHAITILEVKS